MVKQLKTLNVAQGGYEAPRCKVFSIKSETQIMGVSGGANYTETPGGAGGDDTIVDDPDSF